MIVQTSLLSGKKLISKSYRLCDSLHVITFSKGQIIGLGQTGGLRRVGGKGRRAMGWPGGGRMKGLCPGDSALCLFCDDLHNLVGMLSCGSGDVPTGENRVKGTQDLSVVFYK